MALQFGTDSPLTITATSLASAVARSSVAVSVSTTANITQILLNLSILTTATAPTGNKQVVVYGYKSEDGTNYEGASSTIDNVDGTDKALTALGSPSNLVWLGTVQLNQGAAAVTIKKVIELVAAFGCVPVKWGIVLFNDAGTALGATVTATYREGYYN